MNRMKIGILSLAMLLSIAGLRAQENPKTTEFEVNGLKVILRESVKGTVSARLFVNGGTANYKTEKAGVESLSLDLMAQSGPASMSKDEFNTSIEAVGADINASSGYDYGNISLSCVRPYWDKSWSLFAETILNPAWRADDFEVLKNQMITASKQSKTDADSHLRNLAFENAWEGTAYEKNPSGTPESLEGITLEDLKTQYQKVVVKKNLFLVIVGDITPDDLKNKIEKSLAKLPEGKEMVAKKERTGIKKGLSVENRELETNYILGIFDAPNRGTKQSVQNDLAMSILGDRFFEELRTKRSLSYAPAASRTGQLAHPMNIVYISTTDPEQSLKVMVDEINKVKTDGFTEKELEGKKQSYLTRYFMGQESNSSISMSLGINELSGGWEKIDLFTDEVLSTKVGEINTIMQEYGDQIYWTYLGKENLIKPDFFTQPVQNKEIKK